MDDFWNKLKELYEMNPTLFGVLLFLDLLIIMFLIKISILNQLRFYLVVIKQMYFHHFLLHNPKVPLFFVDPFA